MTNTQPQLTWTMTLKGATLYIEYNVTNKTGQTLYLSDQLLTAAGNRKFSRTQSITVMNGDPGTVVFAIAQMSPNVPAATLYPITFRAVAPGTTFTGSAEVPYPLKSWNPVGATNAIANNATSAIFIMDYFLGEPPQWKSLDSDDPKPLKVPARHSTLGLRAGPTALPTR